MTTLSHHAALARELRSAEARLKAIDTPDMDAPHGDDADRIVFREEHEGQVLSRVFLIERRRLILAELLRIEQGTYGRCLACDGVIPAKRLHVLPWAEACIECASREEMARQQQQRAGRMARHEPVDEGQGQA